MTQVDTIKENGRYIRGKDNTSLWYKYSNFGGPVNVFIHGLGGSSYPFEKFQDLFDRNERSSLILDLRGHGFSGKSTNKDYEISHYAADVLHILEKEKIRKANLIGHCFGGMVSMKMFEENPRLVNSMVLISTNHKPNKEVRNIILKEFLFLMDDVLPHLSPRVYYNKEKREFDYSIFDKETDYYLPRMIQDFQDTSMEVMFHTLENIFSENFEKTIKQIQVPSMVVHGKRDTVFNYRIGEEMAKSIENSILDLREDDNHVTHIIDPATNLPEKIYSFIYEE